MICCQQKSLFIILAVALLAGASARAQELGKAKAAAGVTPDSRWYYLDLMAENFWQSILIGPRRKLAYLNERIKERQAEMGVMAEGKGTSSDEWQRAAGHASDLTSQAKEIVKKRPVKEDVDRYFFGDAASLFDGEFVAEEKKRLQSRTDELRKLIVDARASGDESKANELGDVLKQAKSNYDEFLNRHGQMRSTGELIAEQLEDAFTGRDKAELVLRRAESWKERLVEEGDDKGVKRIDALIAEAKQAIADAKAEEAENAVRKLPQAIRETRIDLKKTALDEEAKKDLVAEPKPPAPAKPAAQPKAPAPKPPLKKIPSESVKTAPLQLVYFPNLNGQVDTRIEAQYGGQDGLPPYHFQLEAGVGFPPSGVILDVNGLLSGAPKAAGTYTFSVCVVDTSGESVCEKTRMVVAAAAPPPPPPPEPEIDTSIALTGTSCTGDGLHVDVSGSARGPVNATVGIHYGDGVSCGAWTMTASGACRREAGQLEATQWTFRFYKGRVSGDQQLIEIYAPPDFTTKSVRYEKPNCP